MIALSEFISLVISLPTIEIEIIVALKVSLYFLLTPLRVRRINNYCYRKTWVNYMESKVEKKPSINIYETDTVNEAKSVNSDKVMAKLEE